MTDQDRRLATDERLEKVEGDLSRVRVILEGKPIHDIAGNLIGTEGGIVKQGEQHTEALHVVSHQLTGLVDQLNNVRKPWSLTQRIAMSGVLVTLLLGSQPIIAWLVP